MSRGAAGILTEQVLPCPLPQCIVGDIELALARIASQQLDRPDRKLLSVGVIGSAGKTSTTLLVSSLLRSCGIRTAYQTDLGDCDGIVQSTPSESLPVNAPLVHWLDEANHSACEAAIIELSDQDARRGHYDAVEFDILIVTGSATCAGDYGPSGLQCALERLAEGGVVIAPVDDARAMRVIGDSGATLVSYGVRKAAHVTAKIIEQSGGMTTLLVTHRDTTAVMETSLCGAAMAANHAAAIVVGLLVDQPLQEIVDKLGRLPSIPGRGQRLDGFDQAAVILDAGGSADRAVTALRTFRSMKSAGRMWCVFAVNANDSSELLANYGSLLERFADHTILTAQPESKSKFLSASHAVLDGVEKCATLRLVADRRRAIEWAVAQAGQNDTILVITGEREQTAAEQRADIERISGWVESARRSNEDSSEDSSEHGRPRLKIFK
jgi:UDP-N-acetylmuramoyl-L-alanyl-D-glutamate--2,6-diaminopimelate ligase